MTLRGSSPLLPPICPLKDLRNLCVSSRLRSRRLRVSILATPIANRPLRQANPERGRPARQVEVPYMPQRTEPNANNALGDLLYCALKIGSGTPVKFLHLYLGDDSASPLGLLHMHIPSWHQ